MEHIAEIGEALNASLSALRPKGLLIMSVPNYDFFLNHDREGLLDKPPHHMGIWDENALKNLAKFFPLELLNIKKEPLQYYHAKPYYYFRLGNKINKIFGRWGGKVNIIPRKIALWLLVKPIISNRIIGHTIMGIYQKKVK